MFIHLAFQNKPVCDCSSGEIITETLDTVTCPSCLDLIKNAAIKLHNRRRKDADKFIIQKVLSDKHTLENTSKEEWESFITRMEELEQEVNKYNPANETESIIMNLIAGEIEEDIRK